MSYFMRGSRIFLGGVGGAGVQARRSKNSLGKVFSLSPSVLNLFYSLQRGSSGFITEKTILFQGSRGGSTFSRAVQLFPVGVQMLISIETHNTCDLPGGSGSPTPLSIRTCICIW